MTERLKGLCLVVLYLSGWEEDSRKNPGQKLFRSWKGYPFEILNEFEEKKYITQHRKAKSVVFTPRGKIMAQKMEAKYL
ncbi:MAG: transposase [Candidatus Aminicenantes bacterium]|nr:transposase [Candidatus Aminicenantes bacterium]